MLHRVSDEVNAPAKPISLRACLRDPIPEIEAAAHHLDAAVSAHLAGQSQLAGELIRLADMPAIRAWTESLWGGNSPYVVLRAVSDVPIRVTCMTCGFNFKKAYGTLGEGFIHVHHIIPIGKIAVEYEVNPVTDLVPVCPNCHAMIHRAEPPLTIKQLRDHLEGKKNAQKDSAP